MKVAMNEVDDGDLISSIARRDKEAFAHFYHLYEKRIFHFIRKKMNDPFDAADILHEVFMEVWKNAGRFEGRSKVSTWVFGIAFHKTVDRLRKKIPIPIDDDYAQQLVDKAPSALEILNAADESDHLHQCVGKLKSDQKIVIQLAFFEDMAYGEIATVIDRPEGTVKTRIFYAKQALKHCLAKLIGAKR